MRPFTLLVENLRGLRSLRWSPEGSCLLVGPNGAGKTTVLLTLELLHLTLERGLPEAVRVALGGSHGLRHRDALDDEPTRVGLMLGQLAWSLELAPHGSGVDYLADERLLDGEREVFRRDSLGNFRYGDQQLRANERTGLRSLLDSQNDDTAVAKMAEFLRCISVFHDPDLFALRAGSDSQDAQVLGRRGHNALSLLRAWYLRRPDRHRYQFVLAGLRAAFPTLVADLDFVEAGRTLAARVYRPGREAPEPLSTEANGVLAMLVLLCDLASASEGGVVMIDEPANALHPYAIRVFARLADRWARQKNLTVILATHSPVLLDAFDASPHQVHVLAPNASPCPCAVTELRNPEWLRQFKLGELYADGEFGDNAGLE